MNRGQRTVASLLAVVAVLLGLNLVRGAPPAWAQGQAGAKQAVLVNGAAAMRNDSDTVRVVRFWSDGSVDVSTVQSPSGYCDNISLCFGPTPIIPGTCTADANRNGEVEVNDLLTLLGEWGPCE